MVQENGAEYLISLSRYVDDPDEFDTSTVELAAKHRTAIRFATFCQLLAHAQHDRDAVLDPDLVLEIEAELGAVRLVRVGEHRHLVAALGTRVDDRQRAALGWADRLELHRAVAGDAKELHERVSRSRCATSSRAPPWPATATDLRLV